MNEMLAREMPPVLEYEYRNPIFEKWRKDIVDEFIDYDFTNFNSKGKKMSQIYEVVAIQEHEDKNPTIVVPITTVVAKDNQTAVQNFLIENAEALKGKENLQTLCRPFC